MSNPHPNTAQLFLEKDEVTAYKSNLIRLNAAQKRLLEKFR